MNLDEKRVGSTVSKEAVGLCSETLRREEIFSEILVSQRGGGNEHCKYLLEVSRKQGENLPFFF